MHHGYPVLHINPLTRALVEISDPRNGVEGAVHVQVSVADVAAAGVDYLNENEDACMISGSPL